MILFQNRKVSLRRNMEAVYRLVQCFGQHLSEVWNQSDLLDHLFCDDLEIRWWVQVCFVSIQFECNFKSSVKLQLFFNQLFQGFLCRPLMINTSIIMYLHEWLIVLIAVIHMLNLGIGHYGIYICTKIELKFSGMMNWWYVFLTT